MHNVKSHRKVTRYSTMDTATKRALFSLIGIGVAIMITAGSCDGSTPSAQQRESTTQQNSYTAAVAADPAHSCRGCPTRKTINFWIDTWSKPGALAYVYLQNANGQITGYYVLKGLPVSYCASLTPTYTKTNLDLGGNEGQAIVPAPSIDGVYYSPGGGLCSTYYGQDATTGSYIEYTVGLGNNVLLYSQPLPGSKAGDAKPLGPTVVK
jgi:hypothetical protein